MRGWGAAFSTLILILCSSLAVAAPGGGIASGVANHLSSLARGLNADNVLMTSRMATYTTADVAKWRSMGMTYVRIPVEISYIEPGIETPEDDISDTVRVAAAWARLDQHMAMFTAGGLVVQPVLFVNNFVYMRQDAQTLITQAAVAIATRYAPIYRPNQMMLEILNEPHFDVATWNTFAPKLVAAVRKAAPGHTVVVDPASWALASNFAALTLIPDPNIIYTMHVYSPSPLTGQGAGAGHDPTYKFPKPLVGGVNTEWTLEKLQAYIRVGVDWATTNHVPLTMSEFGTTSVGDHDSRVAWIKAVRAEAEKDHIGWAWWAYDGRLFGINPHEQGYDPELVTLLSK